jgi:hypothetical protein
MLASIGQHTKSVIEKSYMATGQLTGFAQPTYGITDGAAATTSPDRGK